MGQTLANAKALYLEGIRDGNYKDAIRTYTGHRYTQHSTGIASGAEGFIEFFGPFVERNPKRHIDIVHGIQDGRFAFLHAFQSLNDGEFQWVTMDIFDSDAEGRILEHWDVIQAYTTESRSGSDMVGNRAEVTDLDHTEANKGVVLEFTKQVLQEGRTERLGQFVSPGFVQHRPQVAAGRDGLDTWLRSADSGVYEMLFQLLGQGNLVATNSKLHIRGNDHAAIDLYRLADGLIVEQWGVIEEILSRDQWGNSGKF